MWTDYLIIVMLAVVLLWLWKLNKKLVVLQADLTLCIMYFKKMVDSLQALSNKRNVRINKTQVNK